MILTMKTPNGRPFYTYLGMVYHSGLDLSLDLRFRSYLFRSIRQFLGLGLNLVLV